MILTPLFQTLAVILPYLFSKIALAACIAIVQTLFGQIGGETLSSEAAALSWTFLLVGTCEGGMRALSIMVAKMTTSTRMRMNDMEEEGETENNEEGWKHLLQEKEQDEKKAEEEEEEEEEEDKEEDDSSSSSSTCQFLFRGILKNSKLSSSSSSSSHLFLPLRRLHTISFLCTTFYCLVATILLVFTADLSFISHFSSSSSQNQTSKNNTTTNQDNILLDYVQDYSRGFAIGLLPTCWVYLSQQFLLGCQASGIALVYGSVYAVSASLFCYWRYQIFTNKSNGNDSTNNNNNPAAAYELGLGMSLGAWFSFILLNIHLLLDPILRPLCSLQALVSDLYELISSYCSSSSSSSSSKFLLKEYLKLAIPLGISNSVGLATSLIVADAVSSSSSSSSSSSTSYSIANAYFSTLGIALLGASSAISAVVAASSSSTKLESQVENQGENENEENQEDAQNTRSKKRTRTRKIILTSTLIIAITAVILSFPPLIFQHELASLFGGTVSGYGDSSVDKTEFRKFLLPATLSFLTMTLAMCSSAILHAFFDVNGPLVLHVVSYALGAVWTICFATNEEAEKDLVTSVYGSVVGHSLYLILLVGWFAFRH